MSGPFRIPEANVFVDEGRRAVMHQLDAYWVTMLRDSDGRRFIGVRRVGSEFPVDLETRSQVLERCLINLIEPSKP